MGGAQNRKGKDNVFLSIKRLPLFHRTLLIMLCMMLLMLLTTHLSGRIFRKSLTDNYLELAQNKLEQNVQSLCDSIYNISAIPKAVEDSQYFKYIRKEKSGTLPTKSLPALAELRKSLTSQFYLQGENIECLLYFSGSNCIVSRNGAYPYAQDFFTKNIHISEEEQARLLDYMNTPNSHKLFPLQNVASNYTDYGPCWVYTARSIGTSTAVAAFYPVSYVVDSLGMSSLPAETLLIVDSLNGERLATYPAESENYDSREFHIISAQDSRFSCKFTLYIPNAYFEEQMQQVTHTNLLVTVVAVAMGVFFAFFMSRMSTRPLQELLHSHGHENAVRRSEEEILDQILNQNKQVQQALQENLFANLQSKLFSGAILSEAEMEQLSQHTDSLQWPCQVAVIHIDTKVNLLQICSYIRLVLGENAFCQSINTNQIGVLLGSGYEKTARLEYIIDTLQQQYPQVGIRCGVSNRVSQPEQLHIAVQHAKMALPKEHGFEVYTSNDPAAKASLSWMQHERLYQNILNNDRDGAMDTLQQIAIEPYKGTAAREAYYSILFVLRSASSALNVTLEELQTLSYDPEKLPWDNIQDLQVYLELMFDRIREEQEQQQNNAKRRIVEYIDRNFSDCNLCAAMVAQEFMLSEKRIYSVVRELTDMSFNEYLLMVRMRRAGDLLRTTGNNSVEIAIQCGYQAESTFYRVFKRYYGMTPGEYRQQQM